ncbi:MAG: hypothetical protein PHF11_03945 [Candidatus Omnitrophica bacterium]|nr:hypothetical protein [Candidatus Omnitrophota bacterium]
MLDRSIRILDFDASIPKQKRLLSEHKNNILDLRELGAKARYWASASVRSAVEKRIKDSAASAVTFLGSGDFHHITELLISRFDEPMSVIVFDFHPDWDRLSWRFACGSWVNQVLRKKNVSRVILIGPSSRDLSTLSIQSGNLSALKDSRLQIYPYSHPPSLVFLRKIPQNASTRTESGVFFSRIYWDELKNKKTGDFFQGLIQGLPDKKVYVSIDKDCLRNEFALTNWEEGVFSLEDLLGMLKLIKQNSDIVGLDITGDYSPAEVEGAFKKFVSYLDHPRDIKANTVPESVVTAVNEKTNLALMELLNSSA